MDKICQLVASLIEKRIEKVVTLGTKADGTEVMSLYKECKALKRLMLATHFKEPMKTNTSHVTTFFGLVVASKALASLCAHFSSEELKQAFIDLNSDLKVDKKDDKDDMKDDVPALNK